MSKSAKRAHSPTARQVPPIAVLEVAWSDGVSTYGGHPNAPNSEQLVPKSDGSIWYAEVEQYSKKELRWLERLASLIIDMKDPSLKDTIGTRLYLSKFPEHYRLYEVCPIHFS